MRTLLTPLALTCLFFVSSVTAQDDPFGGGGADPFGGAPKAGDAQKAKPDPFGAADPFADGAKKKAKRPAAQAGAPQAIANKEVRIIPKAEPSEATARIRAAMNDETRLEFIETPLEEAVQQISALHDIPVFVDRRSLEEIGLTPDTPVNISLQNVSLRSALRVMLSELDLTYIVKDEILRISTIETAEQNLVVEMYVFPEALTDKSDKVLAALTAAVTPQVWTLQGGPCNASVIDNVLVVSAHETVHEDVIEFLQKLQEAFERHQAKQN